MQADTILVICVLAAVGCTPASNGTSNAGEEAAGKPICSPRTTDSKLLPPRITNQFGMRFRLVRVDASRPDHKDSFPKRSYYLQETELTGEQQSKFYKAAFGDDGNRQTVTNHWYRIGDFPTEWRQVIQYSQALSEFDAEYDYGVPSRSQWLFACMSGYEQRCDDNMPNACGIVDMLDGDVEVIDELSIRRGHEYGTLMGRWINNWGEHAGMPIPDCPCEHWTLCNPDADDDLNEIIVGRLILLPEGAVHATHE